MILLNYSKYDVFAMFRMENPSTQNPSGSDIEQFDSDLFDAFENTLIDVMTSEGLPTTKSVKSTVLLYSRSGGGTNRQKIRAACRYYQNTEPL